MLGTNGNEAMTETDWKRLGGEAAMKAGPAIPDGGRLLCSLSTPVPLLFWS